MFLLMQYSVDIRSMYEYDNILDGCYDSSQIIGQMIENMKDITKDAEPRNANLEGNAHKDWMNM